MTAPRLLSSWPARRLGPQTDLEARNGRAQREQSTADVDFAYPRRSRFKVRETLLLIVEVTASAAVFVGLMWWVVVEMAR